MSIISVDDTEYIDHDQNRTMYIVVPILKLYKIVKIPVGVLKSSRTCILIVQNILCFPAFWTILIVYMPGIVERARSQKRPKIFRTTYVNLLKWCIFFRDRTSTITSLGPLIMDIISITPRSNSFMCRSRGARGIPSLGKMKMY